MIETNPQIIADGFEHRELHSLEIVVVVHLQILPSSDRATERERESERGESARDRASERACARKKKSERGRARGWARESKSARESEIKRKKQRPQQHVMRQRKAKAVGTRSEKKTRALASPRVKPACELSQRRDVPSPTEVRTGNERLVIGPIADNSKSPPTVVTFAQSRVSIAPKLPL